MVTFWSGLVGLTHPSQGVPVGEAVGGPVGEGVGSVPASASVSLVCPLADAIRDKSNKLEIRRENILAIVVVL